jgi:putative restriction endonuclease
VTKQAALSKFDSLNIWKRGDQRAPHKPLLVLFALGRWQQGETEISFEAAAPELTELLQEFGPNRKTDHPELPFFHLQSDGVWKMATVGEPIPRKGSKNFTRRELLDHQATGRFSGDVLTALKRDPALAGEIATRILDAHFPDSLHSEILAAVGVNADPRSVSMRRRRDPRFRDRILTAYEYRCAVCGFDVRLGSQSIALEAAHIKWHQAGGPDVETNGVALCVLHHRVFDLGAFTINSQLAILVSEKANGSRGLDETLLRFHGKNLRKPQRPEFLPQGEFTDWHRQEVFKGRPRHTTGCEPE